MVKVSLNIIQSCFNYGERGNFHRYKHDNNSGLIWRNVMLFTILIINDTNKFDMPVI